MGNYVLTSTGSTTDLQALQSRIQIFGIVRAVSGILAILFLMLTIFLFWKLGIGQAILERTGIAKKKSISQKQQLNAMSHRLTKSNAEKLAEQEFTGQLTGDTKKGKRARKTAEMRSRPQSTGQNGDGEGTTVLSQGEDSDSQFAGKFVVTVNQLIIHTDEMIQEVNE